MNRIDDANTACINAECPFHKICDLSYTKPENEMCDRVNLGGFCRRFIYYNANKGRSAIKCKAR